MRDPKPFDYQYTDKKPAREAGAGDRIMEWTPDLILTWGGLDAVWDTP